MQIARGHTGHIVGERHHKARLTDFQVRHMRALRASNPKVWSYGNLAKRFKCGESTARDIVNYWTRASA